MRIILGHIVLAIILANIMVKLIREYILVMRIKLLREYKSIGKGLFMVK